MKLKILLAILAFVVVMLGIELTTNPGAATTSKKACPAPTTEGAYHEQGHDKQTGEVICGFTYFNECPYASGYPATAPECKKFEQQQNSQRKLEKPVTLPETSLTPNNYGGK